MSTRDRKVLADCLRAVEIAGAANYELRQRGIFETHVGVSDVLAHLATTRAHEQRNRHAALVRAHLRYISDAIDDLRYEHSSGDTNLAVALERLGDDVRKPELGGFA